MYLSLSQLHIQLGRLHIRADNQPTVQSKVRMFIYNYIYTTLLLQVYNMIEIFQQYSHTKTKF